MKDTLCPGLRETRRIIVDETRVIEFMGKTLRVYATPLMVSDMEYVCRDLVMRHLDEGEDSVGARVEIEHLAPTPLGEWVDISVAVRVIDGRRVTVDFEARDAAEVVGRGSHTRFVVDTATTERRLAERAARLHQRPRGR